LKVREVRYAGRVARQLYPAPMALCSLAVVSKSGLLGLKDTALAADPLASAVNEPFVGIERRLLSPKILEPRR
jgi:hypothetical protein